MQRRILNILILSVIIIVFTGCISKEINPNFYKELSFDLNKGFKNGVTEMAFNKNALLFVVGYESGKVELFDAEKSKLRFSFNWGFDSRINVLKFSDNGKYLCVGGRFERVTKIYDTTTGVLYAELSNTDSAMLFMFQDEILIIAESNILRMFDVQEKIFLDDEYRCMNNISSISLSHNEKLLAIGSNGGIELFSIDKGKNHIFLELLRSKQKYSAKTNVNYTWFSLDDSELITLNNFAKMEVWSIPQLEEKENRFVFVNYIRGALLSEDRKSSLIIGIDHKFRHTQYILERHDYEKRSADSNPTLKSSSPHIASWGKIDGQEFGLIEHAKNKLLYRLSQTRVYSENTFFKDKFNEYLFFPNFYKSFAVACDSDKHFVTAYSTGQFTQQEADVLALKRCQQKAKEFKIKDTCAIYARGDYLL